MAEGIMVLWKTMSCKRDQDGLATGIGASEMV